VAVVHEVVDRPDQGLLTVTVDGHTAELRYQVVDG
jgi:hypothetical protein